jgi:hypothetical protein
MPRDRLFLSDTVLPLIVLDVFHVIWRPTNRQRHQHGNGGDNRRCRARSRGASPGDPGAPALTPNIVKGILQYSSLRLRDELGAEYDDLTQGAGSLNDHIVWGTTDSPNSTVWGNLAATESGSPDRAGR